MFLKRLAPKSLYGRFLLIIIVPTVLVQLVATYMFYERHWKSVSRYLAYSLGGEIVWLVKEIQESPETKVAGIFFKARKYMGLYATIETRGTPLDAADVNDLPLAYQLLKHHIDDTLDYPVYIEAPQEDSDIRIQIELPRYLVTIKTSQKRLSNPTTYIFIMWMTGTALLTLIVSILFLRNQVRSISRLAVAAEQFGRGEKELEYFKPQGAKEVRQAGMAFLEMRDRIQRFMAQRTDMLAGISHDLRTPLTRMKLQLAMFKESPSSKALEDDVNEMEAMLDEYLDFLRSGNDREKTCEVQLSALLGEVVDGYRLHNHDIVLRIGRDATLNVRVSAIKRCLTNLINNAIQHANRVIISADADSSHVRLAIDDDGPGVPEEKYEQIFQPFFRLDAARSQNTGGAGLGLSIVRDIVHGHGGHISLERSVLGGLRVLVTLPR